PALAGHAGSLRSTLEPEESVSKVGLWVAFAPFAAIAPAMRMVSARIRNCCVILLFCRGGAGVGSLQAVSQARTTASTAGDSQPADTSSTEAKTEDEPDGPQPPPQFADVIADARSRDLPILVFFSSTKSEASKTLDSQVLPNPDVARSLESWRFQKYEVE